MKKQTFFFTVCFLLFSVAAFAQKKNRKAKTTKAKTADYFNPKTLRYDNFVYEENIKTVLFHEASHPLNEPFIPLNSGEYLLLSFDELGGEANNYSYKIVHCTADWQESDIDAFDYIDGFTQNDIVEYEYSFNTLQDYVQYRLAIPNEDIRLTKSGNYLLKIYKNNDEEDLVLTRRFLVYEQKVNTEVRLMLSNLKRYYDTHHRLTFRLDCSSLALGNALQEIKVAVLQNGRWDNAMTNLSPSFLRNDMLEFDSSSENLFAAGNDFRYIDFRNLHHEGSSIQNIVRDEENGENTVVLHTDAVRKRGGERRFRVVTNDMNGKYMIRSIQRIFTSLDADYAQVHFSLAMEEPIADGNIYVFGALSDWQTLPDFQMAYNREKRAYEANVFLKQGIYDYQYVVAKDGGEQIDETMIEGSYYATENNYFILTYYRNFRNRYDELVGFRHINSKQ